MQIMRVLNHAQLAPSYTTSSGQVSVEQAVSAAQLPLSTADVTEARGSLGAGAASSTTDAAGCDGQRSSLSQALGLEQAGPRPHLGMSGSAPLGYAAYRRASFAFWPALGEQPSLMGGEGASDLMQAAVAPAFQRLANSSVLETTSAFPQPAQAELAMAKGVPQRRQPLHLDLQPPGHDSVQDVSGAGASQRQHGMAGAASPERGLAAYDGTLRSYDWQGLDSSLMCRRTVTDSTRLSVLATSYQEASRSPLTTQSQVLFSQLELPSVGAAQAKAAAASAPRGRTPLSIDLTAADQAKQRASCESSPASGLSGLGIPSALLAAHGSHWRTTDHGAHVSAETNVKAFAANDDYSPARNRHVGSFDSAVSGLKGLPTVLEAPQGLVAVLDLPAALTTGDARNSPQTLNSGGNALTPTMTAGLAGIYGSVDAADFPMVSPRTSTTSKGVAAMHAQKAAQQQDGPQLHHPRPRHSRSDVLPAHLTNCSSINVEQVIVQEVRTCKPVTLFTEQRFCCMMRCA